MQPNRRSPANEDGIALVLAMFMVLVLSLVGASLINVGKSETLSSLNYKTLSQARYSAESGLSSATNYLLFTYTAPGNDAGDPINVFQWENTSPVLYNNAPVVLSSNAADSNYPIAAKKNAFAAISKGELQMGTSKADFTATATLLAMRRFTDGITLSDVTIQTWRIVGTGTLDGAGAANVEVTAIIEKQAVPAFRYAAFATARGCKALTFGGGGKTDSYDSTAALGGGGAPVVTNPPSGGNVGTNGGLDAGGNNTVIGGTLSTPRSGVGNCTANNVTALDIAGNSNAEVKGGLVDLPQNVKYPDPPTINPAPPTTGTNLTKNGGCPAGVAACTVLKNGGGANIGVTLAPAAGVVHSLGNVSLGANMEIHLKAGTYEWNSVSVTGNITLVIETGPVIMRFAGKDEAVPINLTGSSVTNASFKPGDFQLIYAPDAADIAAIEAGTLTKEVKVTGNSKTSLLLYAPRADGSVTGGSDIYGAMVVNKLKDMGGTAIHYDRNLQRSSMTSGNPTMTSFSWSSAD
jgi:type IV pilus assembly PilX-like protein